MKNTDLTPMDLPKVVKELETMREIILTNIVLTGQIPSPTFEEAERVEFFIDRMSDFKVDECSIDSFGNPLAIIRGSDESLPPIFLIAHMDTFFSKNMEHNYTIKDKTVKGAGILDNTTGVGVLLSLPEILRRLNLKFKSDIVLAAPVQSIGEANLKGMRKLLKNWTGQKMRGAICLEGGEIGRLSYFSDGMIRAEIDCNISINDGWKRKQSPNAIIVLNKIINQILEIRLPQSPRTSIIFSKIQGGTKYGNIPYQAKLGFEIHSDSDAMAKEVYNQIQDIINGIVCEFEVGLKTKIISNIHASNMQYNHPLVKQSIDVMKKLKIKPVVEPSESELAELLNHKIPALTLGLTTGEKYHTTNAEIKIKPLYKGIAQVLGVLKGIDDGICDEK